MKNIAEQVGHEMTAKTQLELDAMQALLNAWSQNTKEMDNEAKLRIMQWMLGIACGDIKRDDR